MSNNTIIKEFPMLYGIASNGKVKTVKYYVEQLSDGTCDIVNEHGYLTGKKQIDRRNIKVGKNVGKKNETTVQEQAIAETISKISKKKDNNYTENTSGIPDKKEHSILPMLAQTFSKIDKSGKEIGRKHHIKYPCYCQPKLNGVRCFARAYSDKGVVYTSRKFKEYTTLTHLNTSVSSVFPKLIDTGIPLDGEIYVHGLTFQEIVRRVKKWRPDETEQLEYWIYDIADPTKTFKERTKQIEEAFKRVNTKDQKYLSNIIKVKQLKTFVANNETDVFSFHDHFVKLGYEGVIIRNMDGKYVMGKRSNNLQKYKEFIDQEFKIVGYETGEGRESGAIVFVCKVPNPTANGPKTFEVRPRGSIEQRKAWVDDFYKIDGKELTVRYQELSEDNVPSFPVGIVIRDYE